MYCYTVYCSYTVQYCMEYFFIYSFRPRHGLEQSKTELLHLTNSPIVYGQTNTRSETFRIATTAVVCMSRAVSKIVLRT